MTIKMLFLLELRLLSASVFNSGVETINVLQFHQKYNEIPIKLSFSEVSLTIIF